MICFFVEIAWDGQRAAFGTAIGRGAEVVAAVFAEAEAVALRPATSWAEKPIGWCDGEEDGG